MISELNNRLSEAERYRRRWGLRLYGPPEVSNQEIKRKVIDICRSVAPELETKFEDAGIDIAHRLGKADGTKPRSVIIQFAFRTARDLVWKQAKSNALLKDKKLLLGEDLTATDKQTRAKLWPLVEKARSEGKKAYFRGARAYIGGKEIHCEN